ncbi:MAG: hypothetical protein HY259_04455 [Chloroflexi bacterium]|nr:hypothetical protein [Chloroflexota bacterium]
MNHRVNEQGTGEAARMNHRVHEQDARAPLHPYRTRLRPYAAQPRDRRP